MEYLLLFYLNGDYFNTNSLGDPPCQMRKKSFSEQISRKLLNYSLLFDPLTTDQSTIFPWILLFEAVPLVHLSNQPLVVRRRPREAPLTASRSHV